MSETVKSFIGRVAVVEQEGSAVRVLLNEGETMYAARDLLAACGCAYPTKWCQREAKSESDVKLVVVKNTLLGKALEKVEKADADLVKVLEGPTSIMFTNVAKAPAVLIKEFRKKSEKPVLKAAFAEGCVYVGDDQLDALCNIKSKEELIADIVALLQSPAKNVISALQANAGQKIAGLVKTLESRNN